MRHYMCLSRCPLSGGLQIEQLGEVKILWHMFEFKTLLEVLEDARDPANLVTTFKLLSSVRPGLRCARLTVTHLHPVAGCSIHPARCSNCMCATRPTWSLQSSC